MKKLILTVYTLGIALMATAQVPSLQIIAADTNVVGNASNSIDIFGYVTVKNISNIDGNYLVKRIDKNYTGLTDSNAICWQTCFNPSVSVALFPLTINAGQENREFVGHVYPDGDGVAQSGSITYVFYKEFDPSDSITFTMNYSVTPNFSIPEAQAPSVEVFPNPATDRLQVDVSNITSPNGSFELVDMVGTKVFSKKIQNNTSFELDLSNIARGIYFYSLKQEGRAIKTKKLVVR